MHLAYIHIMIVCRSICTQASDILILCKICFNRCILPCCYFWKWNDSTDDLEYSDSLGKICVVHHFNLFPFFVLLNGELPRFEFWKVSWKFACHFRHVQGNFESCSSPTWIFGETEFDGNCSFGIHSACIKMRKKKSRGKKLWESLSLLGHKRMNNVSAVSTNIRCTTNWNNRIAKAKPKRPLTNAMRFLECGHETLCSLKRQPTTKANTLKWNSTHPGFMKK